MSWRVGSCRTLGAAARCIRAAAPLQPPPAMDRRCEALRSLRRTMAQSMAALARQRHGLHGVRRCRPASLGRAAATTRRACCARSLAGGARRARAECLVRRATSQSRTLFEQIDVGIAVDTPDGLLVPVIRQVRAAATPRQLRAELDRLKRAARDRTRRAARSCATSPSCCPTSAPLAGRYATPVVVPPAVAILGTGRVRQDVIAAEGRVEIHRAHAAVADLRSSRRHRWRGGAISGRGDRRSRAARMKARRSPARSARHAQLDGRMLRAWQRSVPQRGMAAAAISACCAPTARRSSNSAAADARRQTLLRVACAPDAPASTAYSRGAAGHRGHALPGRHAQHDAGAAGRIGAHASFIRSCACSATPPDASLQRSIEDLQPPTAAVRESWQYLRIDRVGDAAECEQLQRRLLAALADVRHACRDWMRMRNEVLRLCADISRNPPPLHADVIAESRALLQYMESHHFTFLGYRESRAAPARPHGPSCCPCPAPASACCARRRSRHARAACPPPTSAGAALAASCW